MKVKEFIEKKVRKIMNKDKTRAVRRKLRVRKN